MTSASKKRALGALAGTAVFALALAGCATGGDTGDTGGSSDSLIVGTTDKVTFIDPAGSYDNGSFAIMNQVYPFLLNSRRAPPTPSATPRCSAIWCASRPSAARCVTNNDAVLLSCKHPRLDEGRSVYLC